MKFLNPVSPDIFFLFMKAKCCHFRVLWRKNTDTRPGEKKQQLKITFFKSSLPLSGDEKCVSAIH